MKSPRSSLERYLPVMYLFVAFVLILALLPTALRPPQAPPPTSAEFSPDAPPDDAQELLLTELSQGTSRTAGSSGRGIGAVEEVVEDAPRVRQRPRKGRCFGDPPRQTDSTYSPPCAPAFVGKNGGANWRGVSATEIRVGLWGGPQDVGPVPRKDDQNQSDRVRTYRIWQQYYNERFELYGRALQFYVVSSDSQSSGSERAAVQKADEEFQVFAMAGTSIASVNAADEIARRKIIGYGTGYLAEELYINNAPYMWSFLPAGVLPLSIVAEMMCKQLKDKPVEYTEDVDQKGKPRVWGIVSYNDVVHYGYADYMQSQLDKCGIKFKEVVYMNIGDQSGEITTAMTKMRTAGVTSIVLSQDGISSVVMTQAATSQRYYPEWVQTGGTLNDSNSNMKRADQNQWKHVIGISSEEMPAPSWQRDYYRAYKEMDPDQDPSGSSGFYDIMQLVGGFQQAGTTLTPSTFQEGMFKRWPIRPDEHVWSVWGGYEPGGYYFTRYAKMIYWDPIADDPFSDTAGAYRYMYGGKGFKRGEVPSSSPWHCLNSGAATPDKSECNTVIWISRDDEMKSY